MTKITVEITINAPISQVWEKRTLPEHITKWNFATDDRECPQVTNDLQVGENANCQNAPGAIDHVNRNRAHGVIDLELLKSR